MATGKHNSVTELLHRKRGEQFRHQQNLLNSRSHISSSSPFIRNKPTLPISLASLSLDDDALYGTHSKIGSGYDPLEKQSKCSGPVPPRSWVQAQLTKQDVYLTAAWREESLSLLYSQLGVRITEDRILPLSVLCLLPLITGCTLSELRNDVLPHIPQHLRKQLVRYMAVQQPLSSSKLWLLYEEDGHSDGELFVMGPCVTIRDDYFIQSNQANDLSSTTQDSKPEERSGEGYEEEEEQNSGDEDDWETDDNSSKLLSTFAAVSTRLSMTTILTLPPTITHLVLIHLAAPIAMHRLPQTCPLLRFLDLSFNEWLESPAIETEKGLARVDWGRWSQLHTLGWRHYPMPDALRARINKGRWDDITIIL